MSFFDLLGEGFRCVYDNMQRSVTPLVDAGDWVADRVDDAVGWAGDVWHGNVGDQAMSSASVDDQPVSVEDLVPTIRHGAGTAAWHDQATRASGMGSDHEDLSARIKEVADGLEHAWRGKAADGARTRIQPLIDVTRSASQTFAVNATSVNSTASVFDEMKRKLEPLPARPPHKNFVDIITPWDTDTEKDVAGYNAAAQRNLEHYRNYDSAMQDYRRQLTPNYGQIDGYHGGNVTLTPASAPPRGPGPQHARPPVAGRQPETPHPHRSAAPPPPPHRSAPPAPHPHSIAPPNNQGAHIGQSSGTGPPVPSPASAAAPGPSGGETETAGYLPVPGAQAGASAPFAGTGLPGAGNNTTDTVVPGSGSPGSPNVPGGISGIGGPGASAEPVRGGSVGGGATREGSATGRVAANSAAEGRGDTGAPGVGGVGGGGRGEDREHKRKYGRDDSSVFTDNDSKDMVDPHTGLRAAPPTLGG